MGEVLSNGPELVPGGPYTIDPAAMDQEYGVPQETVSWVTEDLLAAVEEAGYGPNEVVFAGYLAIESEGAPDDLDVRKAAAADASDAPRVVDPVTGAILQPGVTYSFGTAGDLHGTAEDRSNPIHFAGTTGRARIGVYEVERLHPGLEEVPESGGLDLPVTAEGVEWAEVFTFHPQYRPGSRGSVPEGTHPDDLIGANPDLYREAWRTDAGLPPPDQRSGQA